MMMMMMKTLNPKLMKVKNECFFFLIRDELIIKLYRNPEKLIIEKR